MRRFRAGQKVFVGAIRTPGVIAETRGKLVRVRTNTGGVHWLHKTMVFRKGISVKRRKAYTRRWTGRNPRYKSRFRRGQRVIVGQHRTPGKVWRVKGHLVRVNDLWYHESSVRKARSAKAHRKNPTHKGRSKTWRSKMASFLRDVHSVKTPSLTPRQRVRAIRAHQKSYAWTLKHIAGVNPKRRSHRRRNPCPCMSRRHHRRSR
jgi:hypothetical protein